MPTGKSEPSRTWSISNSADMGRALAGVRTERGMTQDELARAINVDRSYLARLEASASQLVLERSIRALRRMGATITVALPTDNGEA